MERSIETEKMDAAVSRFYVRTNKSRERTEPKINEASKRLPPSEFRLPAFENFRTLTPCFSTNRLRQHPEQDECISDERNTQGYREPCLQSGRIWMLSTQVLFRTHNQQRSQTDPPESSFVFSQSLPIKRHTISLNKTVYFYTLSGPPESRSGWFPPWNGCG